MHDAVISGNSDLLSYIVQVNGIEVDKKNYARLTPYQLSGCHPRISDILIYNGASRLVMVDDETDEDYSSDESDSDDDLYHESCEVDQVRGALHFERRVSLFDYRLSQIDLCCIKFERGFRSNITVLV